MGNRDPAPVLKAEAAPIPTPNRHLERTRITLTETTTTAKWCNPKNPKGKSKGNSLVGNGIGRAEGQGGEAAGGGGGDGAEGEEAAEEEEAAVEEEEAAGEEDEAEGAEEPREEPPGQNGPELRMTNLKTCLEDSLVKACLGAGSADRLESKRGTRAGELSCTTTIRIMTILCTLRIR